MLNLAITGTGCILLSYLLAYSMWIARSEKNFYWRFVTVGSSVAIVALLVVSFKCFSLL